MILTFSDDLSTLEISAQGKELSNIMGYDRQKKGGWCDAHTVSVVAFVDPVLVTDAYKIGELGTYDPVLRDTVFALYGTGRRTTVYDGTSIVFEQSKYPGVWGPSIDTLLFMRALKQHGLEDIRCMAEIGCGPGSIIKYCLEHAPGIEQAYALDIDPMAIRATKDLIQDPRLVAKNLNGMDFLLELNNTLPDRKQKYDLVVCNPPYIPRPNSVDNNPYEGVSLLVDLIENTPEYLTKKGMLLTNISSLSKHIADDAIERIGVSAETIDELTVPLKVFNVLNNKEWLDYLLDHGLEKRRHDGYDYWHTIRITKINSN